MADPFIGELKLVAQSFAPKGWALCNGQLLAVNQNQALFAVLGVTYGGNGVTTFALPNLRGRVPLHQGPRYVAGSTGGEESHILTSAEVPVHNHPARAQSTASAVSPAGAEWASTGDASYTVSPSGVMAPGAVANAGGGQAHENRPPFLVLSWIIALNGVYPSRS